MSAVVPTNAKPAGAEVESAVSALDDTAVVGKEDFEKLWSEMALVHEVDFKGIVGRVFSAGTMRASIDAFERNDETIDGTSREATLQLFRGFNSGTSFADQITKFAWVCLPGALVICGVLAITSRTFLNSDKIAAFYQLRVLVSSLTIFALGMLVSSAVLWFSAGYFQKNWRSLTRKLEPGVALGAITLIAASGSAIHGLVGATDLIADDKSAKAALVNVAVESFGRHGLNGICNKYQDGMQSGEITVKSDFCTKDVAGYIALANDEPTVNPADKWAAEVSRDTAKISWSRKPTLTERFTGQTPTVWSMVLGEAVDIGQNTIYVKVRDGDIRRYDCSNREIAVGNKVAVEIANSKPGSQSALVTNCIPVNR